MNKLVMFRTTNNLHIIGRKKLFQNLFNSRAIVLEDPYFVDFQWNRDGSVEKVYMNTMKLLQSKNICSLNTRHILFEVKPDFELIEMYNDMSIKVKQSKNMTELL